MVAVGRRSSVAEHWQLEPEAMGSILSGATFPFKPLLFQRSTDSGGPDCVVHWHDHYRSSDHRGVPSIGLLHSCDYTYDFSHQLTHTAITLYLWIDRMLSWTFPTLCFSSIFFLVQLQFPSPRPTQLPLTCVELATSPSGASMVRLKESSGVLVLCLIWKTHQSSPDTLPYPTRPPIRSW